MLRCQEGAMSFALLGAKGEFRKNSKGDLVAMLAPGIELEGVMKFATGTTRLDCHFKGEITSEGTIVVGDRGEVIANISAKQISIAGTVKGKVHASECLELKEHAILIGDVDTPTLVIDPGAHFGGHCHMPTVPQEPTSDQAECTNIPLVAVADQS
jgi:cytoskeletal protein CcmA (bactofilin family)